MKNLVILIVVLAIIAAGIVIALKSRVSGDVSAGVAAESKGNWAEAAAQYAEAFARFMPSIAAPDINHSKVVAPEKWKKEMEEYAAWLTGSSTPKVDIAKRNELLGAINRTIARLHADNFITQDSTAPIPVEQYTALWNGAFFARGVAPDPNHVPLAASCFNKGISIIRFSALTSYTYECSFIDTTANRRTSFTLYPESSTFILAPAGTHLLLCRSVFKPAPNQIWRSTPTVISITVPQTASLITKRIETRVVRDEKPVQ
jgi:hypothetical protein